jgi:hypothetical protein
VSNNKEKIKKILDAQFANRLAHDNNLKLQNRLRKMVEKYGIADVSSATQLTETTISQYLRTKSPVIGVKAIEQGELILKQIR